MRVFVAMYIRIQLPLPFLYPSGYHRYCYYFEMHQKWYNKYKITNDGIWQTWRRLAGEKDESITNNIRLLGNTTMCLRTSTNCFRFAVIWYNSKTIYDVFYLLCTSSGSTGIIVRRSFRYHDHNYRHQLSIVLLLSKRYNLGTY